MIGDVKLKDPVRLSDDSLAEEATIVQVFQELANSQNLQPSLCQIMRANHPILSQPAPQLRHAESIVTTCLRSSAQRSTVDNADTVRKHIAISATATMCYQVYCNIRGWKEGAA